MEDDYYILRLFSFCELIPFMGLWYLGLSLLSIVESTNIDVSLGKINLCAHSYDQTKDIFTNEENLKDDGRRWCGREIVKSNLFSCLWIEDGKDDEESRKDELMELILWGENGKECDFLGRYFWWWMGFINESNWKLWSNETQRELSIFDGKGFYWSLKGIMKCMRT